MPEVREPRGRLRLKTVVDPCTATLAAHHSSLAQYLQVMRDGRLAHVTTIREVARAHLSVGGELLHDGEPGGLGQSLQDLHVIHAVNISTNLDIDKHQYHEASCPRR